MAPEHTARARVIQFGMFEANLSARELRKCGIKIKLHGQPFEVLAMLLEQPGEIVTREEFQRRLWPRDTFVDFDHGVNTAVNRLREALADSADNPRFIETVPRRGYRFLAPVTAPAVDSVSSAIAIEANGSVPQAANIISTGEASAQNTQTVNRPDHLPAPSIFTRRMMIVTAASLLGIVLLVGLIPQIRQHLFASTAPSRIQSLAVLPLTNLSSDGDQDYFADGMTDALTTDLGKIGALRVISRTSAMHYKNTKKSLRDVARDLNVDAVVEGTVARSGSHLRITASLVQASPEKHLWAETYDAEVGDALAVQGEIARTVAQQIQITLTPKEHDLLSAAKPVNPAAQDLYLRGVYTFHASDTAEAEKAKNYFERAIQIDPNYAPAYAGLANVYSTWIPGMQGPRELMPKSKEFVLKALALDNTLDEAHSVLGTVQLFYDWDWSASDAEFARTMELNPNNAWAHQWHARGLVARGRTAEALDEAKLTLALDPSPLDWDYPVWIYMLAGRYDLARERVQEQLELVPNFSWSHFELAQIYEHEGRADDAARESLKSDELFGMEPQKLARLRQALATSGAQGYWKQTLENYQESAKSGYAPPVLTAAACMRVGDKEAAFRWLEKGFEERDDLMINLKVEPIFESLRNDPRYQDLIRRVGIPQ